METRCNPRIVQKAYRETGSWRKVARQLNERFGVELSHTAWRDYAEGRHDIANPATRARLGLGARACPICGRKPIAPRTPRLKRIRTHGYQSTREPGNYPGACSWNLPKPLK